MTTVYHRTPRCILCKETSLIEVDSDRLVRFLNRRISGEYIQDIFPDWDEDKREQLLTGTHPECWDKMFSEEE